MTTAWVPSSASMGFSSISAICAIGLGGLLARYSSRCPSIAPPGWKQVGVVWLLLAPQFPHWQVDVVWPGHGFCGSVAGAVEVAAGGGWVEDVEGGVVCWGRRVLGCSIRLCCKVLSMLMVRSNNWWMFGSIWSFESLRDNMMLSKRLMNATVLFRSPSAMMESSCRFEGRKPAASIWLIEVRQVLMKSATRTPPRVGQHLSWWRHASITITAE